MKYSILINQVGIAKAGLLDKTDIIDWAIVDYLKDWFFSEKRKTIFNADEGEYYVWLNLNHLLENMPLLRLNKSALSERLKKLKSLGLIKTFQTKDNSLYFVLTPLCVDMMFYKEPVSSAQYPVRLDEQAVRPGEQGVRHGEQGVRPGEQHKSIISQSIINNNINDINNNIKIDKNFVKILENLLQGISVYNVEALFKTTVWEILPHPSEPNRKTTVRQMLLDVVGAGRRVARLTPEEEEAAIAINNAIQSGELPYETFAKVYRQWRLSGSSRITWLLKVLKAELNNEIIIEAEPPEQVQEPKINKRDYEEYLKEEPIPTEISNIQSEIISLWQKYGLSILNKATNEKLLSILNEIKKKHLEMIDKAKELGLSDKFINNTQKSIQLIEDEIEKIKGRLENDKTTSIQEEIL